MLMQVNANSLTCSMMRDYSGEHADKQDKQEQGQAIMNS